MKNHAMVQNHQKMTPQYMIVIVSTKKIDGIQKMDGIVGREGSAAVECITSSHKFEIQIQHYQETDHKPLVEKIESIDLREISEAD